jgi:hypothetical protein
MVGQLVGVVIMLSTYLEIHSDEKGQSMARRCEPTLDFFLGADGRPPAPKRRLGVGEPGS